MIQLRDLEKSYAAGFGKTYVLRQVNLDVQEGEFVTVMGPSGAGKSTLLGILGMLDADFSGEFLRFSDFWLQATEIGHQDERFSMKIYSKERLWESGLEDRPEAPPEGQGFREGLSEGLALPLIIGHPQIPEGQLHLSADPRNCVCRPSTHPEYQCNTLTRQAHKNCTQNTLANTKQ